MTALLQLILADPERFCETDLPCALRGIWTCARLTYRCRRR